MSSSELKDRLRHFFEQNPQEELSVDDMRVKFDASLLDVLDAMERLKKEGFVLRQHVTYRLRAGWRVT